MAWKPSRFETRNVLLLVDQIPTISKINIICSYKKETLSVSPALALQKWSRYLNLTRNPEDLLIARNSMQQLGRISKAVTFPTQKRGVKLRKRPPTKYKLCEEVFAFLYEIQKLR